MTTSVGRRPRPFIAVAAFAAFLATFNETYLNVAFTPIMEAWGVGVPTVQWLATGYMLGAAVMVPVSAFAYRSVPTRPLFVGTVAVLVAGSVVGALAPSFAVLLAGRVVQALATGLLIPIGMNITFQTAPRNKLGAYMGVMGAMTTLGPSSSVIVAGGLLSVAGWRVLFWVFAGLSTLCLLAGAAWLRDIAELTKPRLDPASVALIGVGLVGLLHGVSTGFAGNLWTAAAAVGAAAVCLALFWRRQQRLEEPLIDLRPLRVDAFRVSVVINMAALVVIFAMNIVVPMHMQSVLGVASLSAALVLFPAIALSCVLSPVAGRLHDRHGPAALLITGFALIAVFASALSLLIDSAPLPALALLYMPVIGGSALIIGPVQSFALSRLEPGLHPHGVTILSTGFQVAGCVGSAAFTGVYAAVGAARAAAGDSHPAAATTGFLAAGLAAAGVALIGLALAVRLRKAAGPPVRPTRPDAATVADIMKTDVWALTTDQTVGDALRLLTDKGISGAPVVDAAGGVVGFLSDGDVLRHLAAQHPAFASAWSFITESRSDDFGQAVADVMRLPVAELAIRHVISLESAADLSEASKILTDHHLRKAPVCDHGRLVGVVNRSNITHHAVRTYFDQRAEAPPAG
ncbi:MAG: MFS transporter [Propionibacteriaceae bacterium]|nr:MFS transporter [Propionibacteriaceae bacterium]